jgi:hypothetical protein
MLDPIPKSRLSAKACLQHSWFDQSEKQKTPDEHNHQISNTLGALKDFRGKLKM